VIIHVTNCGRIDVSFSTAKKINFSTVFLGQVAQELGASVQSVGFHQAFLGTP
jgi:hypothetical protein